MPSTGNSISPFDALESTIDEQSFLKFVDVLLSERRRVDKLQHEPDGSRGEWVNHTVTEVLSAARAWAEDSDFGTRPGPKSSNPWRLFAAFLYAGRGYE